jgi:hypothetical protein
VESVAPLIAWLLVLVTLGVAGYFGSQQVRTLRGLPARTDLAPDDHSYFRRQAWRRLAGCALLVAVATMLSAWYLSGQDVNFDHLGDVLQAQRAAGDHALRPDQEQARRFFVYYVNAMLLLLLALLVLAAFDLLAIRRYAARHSRSIRDDRRAMLERELANLRRERGRGPGEPSAN